MKAPSNCRYNVSPYLSTIDGHRFPCFQVLHYYERYAWIGMAIIFFIMYGLGAKAGI